MIDNGRLRRAGFNVCVDTVGMLLAVNVAAWSLVIAYRWISKRSVILAWLFAAGVIVRAAAGVALFLTSFFAWPLFRSLQLGGGFWTLSRNSPR